MGKEANIILVRSNEVTESARDRANSRRFPDAQATIRQVYEDFHKQGFSRIPPFSIGRVEKEMREYASNNKVEMAQGGLYFSPQKMGHGGRDSHVRDNRDLTEQEVVSFPKSRASMEIWYDSDKRNFFYFDRPKLAKYVIEPNYELKIRRRKVKKVNLVTLERIKNDTAIKESKKYKRVK